MAGGGPTDDDGRHDLDGLKHRLNERGEELATSVYGRPTRRSKGGTELRWGKCGSVQLIWRLGRWWWSNWESGERGSLLDLIADARGCDFAGAVHWARTWPGDDSSL